MAANPTIRLRSLGDRLRAVRLDRGLTQAQVARRINVDEGTVLSTEKAYTRPHLSTLNALMDLYGIDSATRAELRALWDEAGRRSELLEAFDQHLRPEYRTYTAFESAASAVRNFEALFVPGLLQTRAYADAVVRGVVPEATDDEVGALVAARMRRQELVTSGRLQLWAIIDEAAVRRRVGSTALMTEQLAALAEVARRPNVTLQVIPFSKGAHPGMPGCFSIIDFPDADHASVVYVDSAAGDLLLELPKVVRRYVGTFGLLQARALDPFDSIAMIESIAMKEERIAA